MINNDVNGLLNSHFWLFIVGYVIAVTSLAYLLQLFTRSIIRFYEGYWPLVLQKLFTELPVFGQKSIWKMKTNELDNVNNDINLYSKLHSLLFYGYPMTESRILPTRLGNAMRAAEDYSKTIYGMDSVFWWPRLWHLLSDSTKNEIDEALIPIIVLLNYATLITFATIAWSIYFYLNSFYRQTFLEVIIGVILAYMFYKTAVEQAYTYGEIIRVVIDLHRFDLLEALHQSLPETLNEEIELWDKLLSWIYISDRGCASDIKYKHDQLKWLKKRT